MWCLVYLFYSSSVSLNRILNKLHTLRSRYQSQSPQLVISGMIIGLDPCSQSLVIYKIFLDYNGVNRGSTTGLTSTSLHH